MLLAELRGRATHDIHHLRDAASTRHDHVCATRDKLHGDGEPDASVGARDEHTATIETIEW